MNSTFLRFSFGRTAKCSQIAPWLLRSTTLCKFSQCKVWR